jgi:hypothetical protein
MIKMTRDIMENRDAAVDRESHRCQRRAGADNHTAASSMPKRSIKVMQVSVLEFEILLLHVTLQKLADLKEQCSH